MLDDIVLQQIRGLGGYRLVFRDAKNYTFQVTVNAYVNEGRIETI